MKKTKKIIEIYYVKERNEFWFWRLDTKIRYGTFFRDYTSNPKRLKWILSASINDADLLEKLTINFSNETE